jgi:hypothetical protein
MPSERPRGDRTSEAEVMRRVAQVEKRILWGFSYSDLVAFCDGEFGVCERTADRYMAQARENINRIAAMKREEHLSKAAARYDEFIKLALAEKEINVAVSSQRSLDKLLGLDAPERVEHGVSDSLTEFWKQLREGKTPSTGGPPLEAVESLQDQASQ